jgi:site-specific DNA-methyltransferase (adenine-specific)
MEATIYRGDVLDRIGEIADQTVQCCLTSPPYWGLRDYGHDGQLGLETTPEAYVDNLVTVFREVRRIMKDDGVLWLNLGDSYAGNNSRGSNNCRAGYGNEREGIFNRTGEGLKPKDLVGIPWRVALALQQDGWWLRQDIIWHKTNPLPESVTDRCTKAHEYLFMLTKRDRYYFDHEAIKEPAHEGTRNRRSVWTVPVKPFRGAHFAVMPEALCEPPILATSRPGDVVFDPFTGSGTVATIALRHERNYLGVELNPEYIEIARQRIEQDQPLLNSVMVL